MNPTIRFFVPVVAALLLTSGTAGAAETTAAPSEGPTLYERLGGWDGISRVVEDTVALHERNPVIGHYFKNVDRASLVESVTAFFAAGSGGPNRYEGKDMTTAHAHMGLTVVDFAAAVADVMQALAENDVGQREQEEVKGILHSLKDSVLGTAPVTQ